MWCVAPESYNLTQIQLSSLSLTCVMTAPASSSSSMVSSPSQCGATSGLSSVPSSRSSSAIASGARSMAASLTIQKPSPSKSWTTVALADPTGLFSSLELDVCVAYVPALSSLSFFREQHSFAQCPILPQLWHLPLRCFFLPPSVTDKASSVASFFPPWLLCPRPHRIFNCSASSFIWLMRASVLIEVAPWTRCAEDKMCDANVASSLGIPWRMVRSYSLSVISNPEAANYSRLEKRLQRKSRTSPHFAQ